MRSNKTSASLVESELVLDHLDGDVAFQFRVEGFVDVAHAPVAEFDVDLVRTHERFPQTAHGSGFPVEIVDHQLFELGLLILRAGRVRGGR